MKTILYIHHVSDIGGASYCLFNILKELNRNLYYPIVLLKDKGPLSQELEKLDIPVYYLKTLSTVPYNTTIFSLNSIRSLYHLILSMNKFREILDKLHPDMIYLNNMMLYPYLRIAKKKGFKTLIHIREHWATGEHKIQRRLAISYIQKYSDQIIAINKFSASMAAGKNNNVEIIYDWIDFSDRDTPISMSNILNENVATLKVYLFTGGLQRIKGTLEVVKSFSRHLTSENDRLLILGIDTSTIYDKKNVRIGKILKRIGFRTYTIRVLDAIENDKRIKCMPSIYQIKQIICQSYAFISYFTQPHANLALAESIILQTPAIAAETPESLEYSAGGSLAMLFKFNNEKDFVCTLKDFSAKRDNILNKLKKESYQIEQLFDKRRNVQLLNKLYTKILS